MNGTPNEQAQLARLREKTDRQLIALVEHQLERGLSLAAAAESSSRQLEQARKAFADVRTLLPALRGLAPEHRAAIESRLGRLAALLEPAGSRCRPRTQTASC